MIKNGWNLHPNSKSIILKNYCFRKKALYSRGGKKLHPAIKIQKKSGPCGGRDFDPNESRIARKIVGSGLYGL